MHRARSSGVLVLTLLLLLLLLLGFVDPAWTVAAQGPVVRCEEGVSWDAPTTDVLGQPLTALSGFEVFVGSAPGAYGPPVAVAGSAPGAHVGPIPCAQVGVTAEGQWYLTVRALKTLTDATVLASALATEVPFVYGVEPQTPINVRAR